MKRVYKIISIIFTILLITLSVPTAGIKVQAKKAKNAIKIQKKSINIPLGYTTKIKIKKLPKKAKITYKSSKKNIATVSKNGKIKAKKIGKIKLYINVKYKKRIKKLTCNVNVRRPSISNKKIKLKIGEKYKVGIKYKPKNAKCKWSCDNTKIATIKNGVITAKSSGTTRVRAKIKVSKKTYNLISDISVYKDELKNTVNNDSNSDGGSVEMGTLMSDITGAQTNTEEQANFTISMKARNVDLQSRDVALYQDDKIIGYMNDEGKDGDAIKGDNIYSLQVKCISSTETKQNYKVICREQNSNIVEIYYFDKIGVNELKNQFQHVKDIKNIEKTYMEDGTVPKENLANVISAVYKQTLEWKEKGDVVETQKDEHGVYIKFSSGISYLYTPMQKGMDTVGTDVKVSIITCQPFKTWYAQNRDEETVRLDREGTDDAASRIASNFANYSFTKNLDDSNVSLDEVKSFSSNQVILWHGHGGYQEKCGSIIVTGEELDEDSFLLDPVYYLKNLKYTSDYLSGRIVCTNYNQLAVGSAFISKYVNRMDNTFIYAAACESGQDARLANSFLAKGTTSYVGNYNSIDSKYNSRMQRDTVNALLKVKENEGDYFTLKEALETAKNINGKDDGHGAYPIIYGDDTYQLSPSKEGYISGVVKAADTSQVLKNVPVNLYKDNKLIASAKTDANGNYKIKAVHGNYQLGIAFTGYKYFTSNVSVVTNRTTYVENVLLVEDTDAQGTAAGKITNALTGASIEGVVMQIRSGWNVTEGEIVKTIQSDNQGMYSVTLPVGYYTVSMSKDGYVASVLNIYISKNTAENQNGVMNPIGSTDTYRIVLQWGENPRDLDSHIIGKLSNQSNFHVYYNNRTAMDGDIKVGSLDVDDTNGFGNETITLIPTTDAPYSYYVYKYAGAGELINSNAQVKLYKGNQLIKIYNVPVTGNGRYWNVFTLTNGQIQDVNLISNDVMRQ